MSRKTGIRIILAIAVLCLVFIACGKKSAPEQAVSVRSSMPGAAIVELAYNGDSRRLYAASAET